MQPPELQEIKQRALEHTPSGQFTYTDEGRIVYANPQLHRLLDAAPESLIGKKLEHLLPPASRIFHTTHIFPLLKLKSHVEELHLQLLKESAGRIDIIVSIQREVTAGSVLNHCAVTTMTQRHQLEAALLTAKQAAESAAVAKDHFLAVISHELRSPLSAIRGWARIGLSDQADTQIRKRALDTIERNVVAQTRLIDDLLDVSRIVSGKLRLSPRAVDLAPIVEAVIDNSKPTAETKNITLLSAVDRSGCVVLADPDRIQQILWNLISNAIKFTPKGGQVQVTLTRTHSQAVIHVTDTGAGIAAAELPHVFERFWQAESGNVRSGGVGLGLSICKNLTELHGGTIHANSEGIGQGATFSVELPIAITSTAGAVASSPDWTYRELLNISLEGTLILVVDDDEDTREQMRIMLEAVGARVLIAISCSSALEVLKDNAPDILISDIGLPGEDGYELIKRIRSGNSSARDIPAVAVTGLTRPQDRIKILHAGFQAHLGKPIEPAEVVAVVHSLRTMHTK